MDQREAASLLQTHLDGYRRRGDGELIGLEIRRVIEQGVESSWLTRPRQDALLERMRSEGET